MEAKSEAPLGPLVLTIAIDRASGRYTIAHSLANERDLTLAAGALAEASTLMNNLRVEAARKETPSDRNP